MAKQNPIKNTPKTTTVPKPKRTSTFTAPELKLPPLSNTFRFFPFTNQTQPIIILILIGFIFYITSLYNEHALDDGIIIHQNEYVIKGIKGIKEIMTKDAYDSFYRRMNATDQLAGGRYRPLSVVSFAIEQEIIGKYDNGQFPPNCWDYNKNGKNDPDEDINNDGVFNEIDCQTKGAHFRHFNNIWTFVLAVVFLYLVMRNYWFREWQDIAFLSALLFVMHPIHTEAIANVKSRDEIFSLIFVSLTFLFAHKYLFSRTIKDAFLAALMFFLALLSKEYAVVLLGLIPIAFYVFHKIDINIKNLVKPALVFIIFSGLMIALKWYQKSFATLPFIYVGVILLLFNKELKLKNLNTLLIWLYGAFLFYLGLRLNAVVLKPGVPDTEILNNPYLLASGEQKFFTKSYVLLIYIMKLIYPHPLSSDYSYNTIEYRNLFSWDAWLSIILHLTLAYLGFKLVLKRHSLGFAIALYFAFLLMIGNIIMDIGATMGERLIFHSSIGFSIVCAYFILKGLDVLNWNLPAKRVALVLFLIPVTLLYGAKTWERNWAWKNDITLFIGDVTHKPHSVLVLGNAGARWIDLADTKYFVREPYGLYLKEGKPFSTFEESMLQFKVKESELKDGCNKDAIILPDTGKPQKLTTREKCLYKGIGYLKHATELHPRYVNGYLNLGLAYYKLKRDREALFFWKHAEKLYPNNPYLRNYYIVYYNDLLNRGYQKSMRGRHDSAVIELNKCIILDKYNPEGWYSLGAAYFNIRNYRRAYNCWKRCLELKPDHQMANQAIKNITPQMLGIVPNNTGIPAALKN